MKDIITVKSEKFLKTYLNNSAPTGWEASGQKLWLEYIKPYIDEHIIDTYGTAVGVINPGKEYKVVIEAHADEISWFVHYITKEGFIYVTRNGGSDHQIAPSKRVNIQTEKGIVKGVFGWPAIHVRSNTNEEAPSLKNLTVDVGCNSKEEVEALGIHVGCVMTYEDEFIIMNNSRFVGRALDNRIGGFMIAEVARLLHERKVELPFSLYVVNAVQEEIGLRGAQMIVERIRPNAAIVTDVCHDTQSPMYKKIDSGDLSMGKGPVLSIGPMIQQNLLKLIVEAANEKKIPFQRQAASRATGTDTDAFAYNTGGVASALISLPMRYMHTTVETVDKVDVEAVIRLIFHSLEKIQNGHDFRYLK